MSTTPRARHQLEAAARRMSFRWLTLTVMLVGLVFAALAFAVLRVSTIAPRTSLYAFYVDWDSSSYLSLSNNIASISTLVPEWYHLGADGTLSRDNPDTEARTMALIGAKRPGLRITPIVNDLDKATGQWDSNAVARMLRDPAQRAKIADEIVSAIHRRGFQGVNIDFEGLPVSSKDDLTAFMAELHDRAQPLGLEVTQDVALSDSTFDLPALANNVDYLIPMMYDEHWSTSGAGPIASQPWFEDGLATLFKEVPPAKVIVAYGDYGFEWRNGTANAKTLSFAEAIATARSAGVPVTLDATSLNPTFSRPGYSAWLLDGATAFNQLAYVHQFPVHGVALWRLGGGDSGMWTVVKRRDSLDGSVAAQLDSEKRRVTYDPNRKRIVAETISP